VKVSFHEQKGGIDLSINNAYELEKPCELYLIIIHPGGDESKIGVIDEQFCWELDDYCRFGTKEFFDLEEALNVCKQVSEKLELQYIPFESSYCNVKEFLYKGECLTLEDMDKIIEECDKDGN